MTRSDRKLLLGVMLVFAAFGAGALAVNWITFGPPDLSSLSWPVLPRGEDVAIVIGTVLGILFLGVLGVVIYFAPSFVGFLRHHHNAVAILALNFFLGWTLLGWVGALVWSLTEVKPQQPERSKFAS